MKRMKTTFKKAKKGFTLIEIIVVLVILAIMAAIAVPAVTGYIQDAKNSKYVADARSIYLTIQAEEAKYTAEGTAADYAAIAKKVTDDEGMKAADIECTSITYDSTTKKYTIVFTDDKISKTAEVTRNKNVTIK